MVLMPTSGAGLCAVLVEIPAASAGMTDFFGVGVMELGVGLVRLCEALTKMAPLPRQSLPSASASIAS